MEEIKPIHEWKHATGPVLKSKKEEFHEMGYSRATNEDIWNCLVAKVWSGNPSKRLYEVVQDILHLSSDVYLSYLTVNAYQDDTDLMESIAALTEGDVKDN